MAHVLILDGDAAAGESLAHSLMQCGHSVCLCTSPSQALRRNRGLRFDVAWLALPLAGMETRTFLRKLCERRPHLPVVVTHADPMDRPTRLGLKLLGVRMILPQPPPDYAVREVTAYFSSYR